MNVKFYEKVAEEYGWEFVARKLMERCENAESLCEQLALNSKEPLYKANSNE